MLILLLAIMLLLTISYIALVVYPVYRVLFYQGLLQNNPISLICIMAIPLFIVSPIFICCIPYGFRISRASLYSKLRQVQ